jgi:hypothetical protein
MRTRLIALMVGVVLAGAAAFVDSPSAGAASKKYVWATGPFGFVSGPANLRAGVYNPGKADAKYKISYIPATGAPVPDTFTVPAGGMLLGTCACVSDVYTVRISSKAYLVPGGEYPDALGEMSTMEFTLIGPRGGTDRTIQKILKRLL